MIVRDGQLRESHHSVRMPTIPELRAVGHRSGVLVGQVHGSRRSRAVDPPAARLIVIATV